MDIDDKEFEKFINELNEMSDEKIYNIYLEGVKVGPFVAEFPYIEERIPYDFHI
jgi:hypothetical protein